MLSEVNTLGPFFAIQTHAPGAVASAPWQPFTDLIEGPFLRERIMATRAALAAGSGRPADAVELRVAASVTQLGLAARLLSPALAAAVFGTAALDLDPARLWWQPVLGGPVPLSVPLPLSVPGALPGVLPAGPMEAPAGWAAVLAPVAALVAATERVCAVSPTVLWGNVASAVNGATTMIVSQRPELAARARACAVDVLGQPPLSLDDPPVGPAFRRNSCCLIYRVDPGPATAVCGDCVLTR